MVPGERWGCQRVNHGYPLPSSRQFRDVSHRCVQSACRMDLFTQARNLGIQTEFIDGQGHRHVTDAAVPPLRWKIMAGPKVMARGQTCDRVISWPSDLSVGSYRLHLTDASSVTEETPLMVAPPRAFDGDFDRCWLLAVQLYGIRSPRNWGIGDFSDLEGLLELASQLGADGVGLNPLHTLFDDRPADCSPYSPNSRLFLNPLYIDVEKLPEFQAGAFAESDDTIVRLRGSDIVDYAAVAELKWRGLRSAFEVFKTNPSTERLAAFSKFRNERGAMLSRFA